MKKGIYAMFFICLCLAVAVVFPRLSTSEERVDHDSTCMGCHVNDEAVHDVVVLHNSNHFISSVVRTRGTAWHYQTAVLRPWL